MRRSPFAFAPILLLAVFVGCGGSEDDDAGLFGGTAGAGGSAGAGGRAGSKSGEPASGAGGSGSPGKGGSAGGNAKGGTGGGNGEAGTGGAAGKGEAGSENLGGATGAGAFGGDDGEAGTGAGASSGSGTGGAGAAGSGAGGSTSGAAGAAGQGQGGTSAGGSGQAGSGDVGGNAGNAGTGGAGGAAGGPAGCTDMYSHPTMEAAADIGTIADNACTRLYAERVLVDGADEDWVRYAGSDTLGTGCSTEPYAELVSGEAGEVCVFLSPAVPASGGIVCLGGTSANANGIAGCCSQTLARLQFGRYLGIDDATVWVVVRKAKNACAPYRVELGYGG